MAVADLTKREAHLATGRMRSSRHASVVTDLDMHQHGVPHGGKPLSGPQVIRFVCTFGDFRHIPCLGIERDLSVYIRFFIKV